MTRLATAWLVYRLTDSAFLLGLVSFAGQAPSLVPAAAGRRLARPLGSPQGARRHPGAGDAAVAGAGGPHAERLHQHPVDHRAGAVPGRRQRGRDPHPPGVRGPDDRRPRRPQQRHRAQLVELQRRAAGRPGHCRLRGGRGRRGLLLPDRRPQLHRGDLGTAVDAADARRAPAGKPASSPRADRRLALRRRSPRRFAAC